MNQVIQTQFPCPKCDRPMKADEVNGQISTYCEHCESSAKKMFGGKLPANYELEQLDEQHRKKVFEELRKPDNDWTWPTFKL